MHPLAILGTALLASATSAALANPRPLAVLDEGAISITRDADVTSVIELAGGRVVASGQFDRVGGAPQRELVLLAADGTRIPDFAPRCAASASPGAPPRSCAGLLVALPDGGFLVAGTFGAVDGVTARGIARFDANGGRVAFDPLSNTPGSINAIALVGERVYVALGTSTGTSVRRFALDAGATVDLGYLWSGIATAIAGDAAGRPYVLIRDGNAGDVVRLRRDAGAIDLGWFDGVAEPIGALAADAVTDRLFVISGSESSPAALRRLDPNRLIGLEADWAPQSDGGAAGTTAVPQRIVAAGAGALLVEERVQDGFDVTPGRYRSLAAATGSEFGQLSSAAGLRAFAARPGGGWVGGGSDVGRRSAALMPDPLFAPRVRRAGAVNDVSRATNGRLAIVGEFQTVDGIAKPGVARLGSDFAVDGGWPQASVPRSWCFSYRCTRGRVAIHPSGAVVAIDRLVANPIIFPPSPDPRLYAISADGTLVRSRSVDDSEVRIGPDGLVYLSRPWRSCVTASQWAQIARAPIESFLPPSILGGCVADPSWEVPPALRIAGPLIDDHDEFVYYVTRTPSTSNALFWSLQRISRAANALPDPTFVVPFTTTLDGWFDQGIAGDANFIYLGSQITEVGGVAWSGPVRVSRTTALVDATWQPGAGQVIHSMSASTDAVYLIRSAGAFVPLTGFPLEVARISTSGTAGTVTDVLPTDGFFDQFSGSGRAARVVALPDGRAIVVGHFTAIDGVARDGFAVVGSAERVFASSFEAASPP